MSKQIDIKWKDIQTRKDYRGHWFLLQMREEDDGTKEFRNVPIDKVKFGRVLCHDFISINDLKK